MSLISKNPEKHRYDLINDFRPPTEQYSEVNDLSKATMLTPTLRAVKVVYRAIKKIESGYVIFTVKRYNELDFYSISIYIPQTCRNFVCYLYPSDIWKLDVSFLENIFPSKLFERKDILEALRKIRSNYRGYTILFEE